MTKSSAPIWLLLLLLVVTMMMIGTCLRSRNLELLTLESRLESNVAACID